MLWEKEVLDKRRDWHNKKLACYFLERIVGIETRSSRELKEWGWRFLGSNFENRVYLIAVKDLSLKRRKPLHRGVQS